MYTLHRRFTFIVQFTTYGVAVIKVSEMLKC